MSVPNQTPYNIYTANGLTTVFTYEFYIISASDLQVSLNGSVVTNGYTVAGAGNKEGGDITFLTPPASGAVVMLERVVPTYRLTDYQDNGDLLADTVNKDFDRIWMAIQRVFIDLGFALTRPFFGGSFNAKGYRIENLADPVNDQDATTKKFVIENGKTNLARTLRVPESTVALLPSIEERKNSLLGWNSQGNPIPIFAMTDTADLALRLSDSNGSHLVGYRYSDVYSALSRMLSYQDYNVSQPALGRDQAANQVIWNEQTPLDLKHRGGIFAGKDTFGIRENATVASFRANTSSGSAFVPQVAGSDDVAALAQSGALDSVAVFADVWLGAYQSWEDIATADYTATSFIVNDASLLNNVKVGQYLITKHSAKYVGIVTAINGATVSVEKWVSYGTTNVGTPDNGIGLYINPIKKGWAFNGNVLIGPNSRAEKCAIMELGLQNNGIADVTLLTGADIVTLNGTYGGGDGARIRGSSAINRWDNNVHAYAGVKTNFRSSDGSANSTCNIAAFLEESASNIGFQFSGRNTDRSMSWKSNTTGLETKALAPWGHRIIDGSSFATLSNGGSPGTTAFVWFVGNSSAFSIVLPNPANFTPGREFEFILASTATVTFTNAGGTVNGASSYAITPSYSFSRVKAIYGGSNNWYVTR